MNIMLKDYVRDYENALLVKVFLTKLGKSRLK